MVRMIRSCIQSILKLLNSLVAMAGIAMLLYSGWMIIAWKRETGALPSWDDHHQVSWFIYTFLSLGIALCVITCCGHVAAETANGCSLYLYMLFIFMLIILEAGVTVDVFLNHDWEKDFPKDPSMNFEQFKNFIRSNFEICKWVGLIIVSTQGFCLLLAMVLKALGPHQYYDSDDEYASNERVPLLKNAPPSYVAGGPFYGSRSDAWNIRINDKANR